MMRKTLTMLLIFIMLFASEVAGDQVAHVGFEGFSISTVGDGTTPIASASGILTSYVLVWSGTFSFPNQKFLSGLYLKLLVLDDDGTYTGSATVMIQYSSDGSTWYSVYDSVPIRSSAIYDDCIIKASPVINGTTFDIKVYVKKNSILSSTDTAHAYLQRIVVYTMNEPNGGILSKLTELKYLPPGADGTSQGLLLNQTEIYLKQPLTLSEGAIAFWLKWDGSTNVQISDNVGIDANGYLYIKNDDGTIYTLEGVKPPIGTYVPVYIGWGTGQGYIMLNNTIINLNWDGNVTITKVGSITNSTATIIDEFKVWDTYITPEQFQQGEDTTSMTITFPNGVSTVKIQSDDGSPLTTVQVSLFDVNHTFIANDTYNGLGDVLSFNVSANEIYAVFTTPAGSTTVYIMPNETLTVAVPGQSQYVQAKIEPVTYPSEEQKQWVWLIIKDSQNRVVYRNKWDFTATPVILRVGGSYLISVATEDFSKVQGVYFGLASSIIKINLPKLSELTLYDNLTLFYDYDPQEGTLRIYYYDPSATTTNVYVTFYDIQDKVTFYANFGNVNLVNFKTTTLPYKFEFRFTRGNETYNWTQIIGHFEEGESLQEIGSKELMGLTLTVGMLFAFGALSAEWAPIITLIFGAALSIAGLISFPATVASFMGAMGFMAFAGNLNLSASSLKGLAIALVFTAFAISVGVGVANYYGYIGWGTGGYTGSNYIDVAGQQVVFWQEYTPTYSDYGMPLPTDAKQGVMPFIKSMLFGFPQLLMSLGAPPVFALATQALIWAGFSAIMLHILLGREV